MCWCAYFFVPFDVGAVRSIFHKDQMYRKLVVRYQTIEESTELRMIPGSCMPSPIEGSLDLMKPKAVI